MKFRIYKRGEFWYLQFEKAEFIRLIEKAVLKYMPAILRRELDRIFPEYIREIIVFQGAMSIIAGCTVLLLDFLTL